MEWQRENTEGNFTGCSEFPFLASPAAVSLRSVFPIRYSFGCCAFLLGAMAILAFGPRVVEGVGCC